MPGLIVDGGGVGAVESAQVLASPAAAAAASTTESLYTVAEQEVELDVDFRTRTLKCKATILIEPQSKELRSVSLQCRALRIEKITVDGVKVQLPKWRDPYTGLEVRDHYGVRQHHQMRANVFDATQEPPDFNATIPFPREVRVRPMSESEVTNAAGAHAIDGAVEAALVNNLADGEAMFQPIRIVVEYEIDGGRDSLQWVGLREGDSRYPHVFTRASSLPGSLPCFVFPLLASVNAKCAWKLTIRAPRTLGDLARKSTPDTNGVQVNGVNGHDADVDAMDEDEPEDTFLQKMTSEERNRDIVVVGPGVVEDSDAPCKDAEHWRKWVFQCSVPVAPAYVGFTIGPFEKVDFSEFRETGKEDQLKDNAVGVEGFCLPGRADEMRNTCLPLQMAIDSFMQNYISYPFAPECQTYKVVFVDDLAQDVVDIATLSLCSSRLLFPETIVDGVWENSRTLIRAAASQWLGVYITPKANADYWIVVGGSFFMAENFMGGLWGRNELRYRQKLAADLVKIRDKDMPSIYECGNAISLDPAELEFLELKAPLVLYLLHQRLVKQSSANGVIRILTRMLSDARSEKLPDNEIWTERFHYTTEKVAHSKVGSFFDQWVTGAGVPSFLVSHQFQKKKFAVQITIKQTQKLELQGFQGHGLQSANFFREVKEWEHEIYAPTPQDTFTGPMTIRVHEPSGLPYEQIVEVNGGETKVEFNYQSKNKNQLRKRRQRIRDAAAGERGHVAEDGDDLVPTYQLGDILMTRAEMNDWRLVNFTDAQDTLMENASYEWIRVDKDFEWISHTTFHPGAQPGELELMYIMQLQGDNDVVAHLEAIQRLSSLTPSYLLSSVFVRTLMDSRYFYGVRVEAAKALVATAVKELDYIGQYHLDKAFKTLFCFEEGEMTRPNDFADLRLYRIRCAIVQAMSRIRDDSGKAPTAVKEFFLDKLKFNDNSSNQFSDSFYVAFLISGLTHTMASNYNNYSFSFDLDPMAEAREAQLKRAALGEIERMRRIDEWIPSYRNVHTRAALRGLVDLMQLRIIPKRMAAFLPYTRPGNHDEVRLEAFEHLITLGMMANDTFLKYMFSTLASEPSAYFRDRIWQRIHRGLASIALGETKLAEPAEEDTNGFTIDTGETQASRNEALERSTLEGALKWMKKQLGNNQVLQQAIMDALRSPMISLKDFNELLDICSHLYDAKDQMMIRLRLPRYWRVQHQGNAKLRFYEGEVRHKISESYNKARKDAERKESERKRKNTSDERGESPEAKRRKSGPMTIKLTNAGSVPKPPQPAPVVAREQLPSPGPSQGAYGNIPRAASPLRHMSPAPAVATVAPPVQRAAPSPAPPVIKVNTSKPKTTTAAAKKHASPGLSKKGSPAARASPAITSSRVAQNRVTKIRFTKKRADFAGMVRKWNGSPAPATNGVGHRHSPDAERTSSPAVSVVQNQTNGTVKKEKSLPPAPLASIPALPPAAAPAVGTESADADTAATPKEPTKVKLKFSFGKKKD